ncbi:MAG: amidohydrolase family protein [Isosphaeraceae bacterium]
MQAGRILGPALLVIGLAAPAWADGPIEADWWLKGATVVDGTGKPGYVADVAIRGDRIVAIGRFEAKPGAKVIDLAGQVLAPGFIDLHTHSDGPIVRPSTRSNINYLKQGVTTIVTGNCGSGPTDVAEFLAKVDADGAGSNVIHLIPHGSLRAAVMGNKPEKATPEELDAMRKRVEEGMKGGAWGMSTGLIYLPGRYADTAELIELSKVVSRHGGLYASHMRDEGTGLLKSIDEILKIGREANLPVHISHLKAGGKASWGLVKPADRAVQAARKAGQVVTADQYPYIASSTALAAMIVPDWARRGTAQDFSRFLEDPAQREKLRGEIEKALDARNGGASVRIARYRPKPSRIGKDLAAIAKEEGISVLDVVLDIESNGGAQAISFGMDEADVRFVMGLDYVATASDGSSQDPATKDMPHPRSFGTFPRKIRYALDEKILSLEAAIRSNSGLPAEILCLPDRGLLKEGFVADLVAFDPATFRDAATFDEPTKLAPGISYLFVNGVAGIAEGKETGKLAGTALRLQKDGPPDLILRAGRIWTGDPDRPWAEAVASREGVIVAVGKADEVLRLKGSLTKVIDRPDAFATPGLHDAHGHLTSLGEATESIDLRGVDSPEKVATMVAEWMKTTPADRWIVGRNWDQSLWPGGSFPTSAVLDRVAADRPVWLTRVDGHAGWGNSEALRRAGILKGTQPPSDGQILRDADDMPTGVFIDGAMGLVERKIPASRPEDLERHILEAQRICLENGLTCVHDAGEGKAVVEAFRRLDGSKRLKLRVYGMASPPEGREPEFVSKPPEPSKPGDRFELRAIKMFMDGAMGSRGALVFEPYSDDPHNKGLTLIPPDRLKSTTIAALQNGWHVCTHAIGDRGNATVIDAYEAARQAVPSSADPRLRIEHAQVVRRADVARLKPLGIIASMQPSHAGTDMRWADARLGQDSERVQGAYAWRWFLDAGVRVAFGSDFPVEIPSPFWGIYAGVTRQDPSGKPPGGWHPDQKMTLEETLRGFTEGAAFAMFAEDRLGVLRPGYRADLTVMDRDLFRADPADLLATKVLMTVIDGEVAFEK